eukprot:6177090-Pleurochrysis_carterae.AAC.1
MPRTRLARVSGARRLCLALALAAVRASEVVPSFISAVAALAEVCAQALSRPPFADVPILSSARLECAAQRDCPWMHGLPLFSVNTASKFAAIQTFHTSHARMHTFYSML